MPVTPLTVTDVQLAQEASEAIVNARRKVEDLVEQAALNEWPVRRRLLRPIVAALNDLNHELKGLYS